MGGKTATTTQKVQIPPEVMARYNAVNLRAEQAAGQPFQQYGTDPSAFVAQINPTQMSGIGQIAGAGGGYQPYYQAGAGLTLSGAQGVGPLTQQQIGYYQNPFTQAVAGTTFDALRQQQQQEMQGATANAIRSGAFGGDRAGLVAANLARQQQLGTAQALAPIFERGYSQAVQTATGQQGVEAQNLQRQLAAGQQIAGLGTGLTQTGLAAGQALLGAGTAEQQTEQAGLQALYNQFLQERGYPFQVAQFLANIAMGTGALSGSTTTTQQPVPFFSDEREKTNVQPLGRGLYAYDYIDDVEAAKRNERPMPPKRVGPMAQDIEERNPNLVGEVGGHKVVKGLVPESMGGAVVDLEPHEYRSGYANGGMPDFASNLREMYAMFGPRPNQDGLAGPYGGRASFVPSANLPVRELKTAGPAPRSPQSDAQGLMGSVKSASDLGKTLQELYGMGSKGLTAARSMLGSTDPEDAKRVTSRPYASGGGVDKDDPMANYGPEGPGIDIPTERPDIKPLEPAKPPPAPNSVMGDILGLAKTAASIYSMSDERMKSGMEPVGELYNGLPVYKYQMEGGPTQIGLSAQEAGSLHPEAAIEGPDGLLRLDYDRATRSYGGGLVPRNEYQAGGSPEDPRSRFINQMLPHAMKVSEETGLDPRLVIAQSALETGWGRSAPGQNYFGIKSHGRSGGNEMETTEVVGGSPIRTRESFRSYPDMASSAADYSSFLRENPRYRGLLGARDLESQISELSKSGYATDPAYGRKVSQIVSNINLPEGTSSYAREAPRSGSSNAIDRIAPPAGLATGRGPARTEEGFAERVTPRKLGSGERQGLGEFLTSKQFLIPALTGLGAMASSPSLYAGSAVLQGLGAGAQAYSNLEKREQELAGMRADESRTYREIGGGQTRVDEQGRTQRLVYIQGRPTWVDEGEFRRAQRAGDPYTIVPTSATTPARAPSEGVTAGLGQRPAITTAVAPPAAPEAPEAPEAPTAKPEAPKTAPIYESLPQDVTQTVTENARKIEQGGIAGLSKEEHSPFRGWSMAADSSRESARERLTLAKALAETPRSSSAVQTGEFSAQIGTPVVQWIRSTLSSLGADESLLNSIARPQDLANTEVTKKISQLMAAKIASGGDQRSYQALEAALRAVPTQANTPGGAATLIADLFLASQEAIDKESFGRNARSYVENPDVLGMDIRQSEWIGRGLDQEFYKRMRPVYEREKKILEELYKIPMQSDGRPTGEYLMSYIIKNGGRIPDEGVRKAFVNKYGQEGLNVLRYFGGGTRGAP